MNHHSSVLWFPLLVLATATAAADDCVDYAESAHWLAAHDIAGACNGIHLAGDRAYLATGGDHDLVIVDVSQPTEPVLLGGLPLPGNGSHDLIVLGDLAYSANLGGGLQIVNVADPAAPLAVGALATEAFAFDVAATAGVVLVSEWERGVVTVVDVSDPTAPVALSTVTVATKVEELAAEDGYAYVLENFFTTDALLHVVDLADPIEPVIVASLELGGWVTSLDVAHGYAYAGAGPGLVVIDLADPTAPVVVGSCEAFARTLAVDGDRAYAAHGFGGIDVIDISDPTAPERLAEVMISDESRGLAGAGPILFTANTYSGLNVVDVAIPANPPSLGQLNPPSYTLRLTMVDRLVYVGGFGRLRIVDAADPTDPAQVGEVASPGVVGTVIIRDDLAYMVDDSTGLHVVDVADATAPEVVGLWSEGGETVDIAAFGSRLVATHRITETAPRTLSVLDLTDPLAPVALGKVILPHGGRQVVVSGNHAFVTSGRYPDPSLLTVVALADPAAPAIVAEIFIPGSHYADVLASGNTVVVAADGHGILIIDAADPTTPVLRATAPTPGAVRGLALVGDVLYAALREAGVMVLDLADPAQPTIIGSGLAEGDLRGLTADDGLVVVSMYDRGLQFNAVQCDGSVPIAPPDEPPADSVPVATRLTGAYPNPFNPRVTVALAVDREQRVTVSVFDLRGRRVAGLVDRVLPTGDHAVTWDGCDAAGRGLPTGAYVVRLEASGRVDARKILLAR